VMHFSITRRKWQENPHHRAVEKSKAPGANAAPGAPGI
jgi:hypothetical protein